MNFVWMANFIKRMFAIKPQASLDQKLWLSLFKNADTPSLLRKK